MWGERLVISLKDHPFLISSQEISEICKPLFEYIGIKYFDWIRTYEDGGRLRLTTHPRWVEHYLTQEYYKFSQLERHPSLYRSGFTIWDYQAHKETTEVSLILKDMRENFNRGHGLSILKVHETYMDNFIFTTEVSSEDINPLYLSNIESIERFTIYFISRAEKLISKAQKVFLPLEKEKFLSGDGSALQNNYKIKEFIASMPVEKAYLCKSHNSAYLSKRETQCLIYSLKGKSAKEIARILYLSPRSIETYLENIKSRLGFKY